MFGPGFVWLVKTRQTSFQSSFRILSTYIAGSPLAGAHFRRQGVDQNTQSAASASSSLSPAEMAKMGQPVNSVGAMGAHSAGYNKGPKVAYGGIEVTPLLCVSTWEHSWLRDWQITGGKENFLTAWWDRIDWEVVNTLAGDSTKGVGGFRTGKSVKEGGQYGFNR
jgi:Fe-Mn family superoxide dismutase